MLSADFIKHKKVAFTMSEVLITLGIIGIVAAMTLPTVITKYKRKTAETKLAKFYSVINQAIRMSIAEHGEIIIDNENKSDAANAEYIEQWYKENITKYIKTINEEGKDKYEDYYKVAFIDGSGFSSYLSGSNPANGKSNLYIFYCLNYKTCEPGHYEGENQFLFSYSPETQSVIATFMDNKIETLKQSCYDKDEDKRHGCTALIQANGWKIPDDYPWIR